MTVRKTAQIYEGKAKKVYDTTDPALAIVSYKDDATAFNGLKRGTIAGKGVVNNRVSNHLFRLLEKEGVPTHYVEELSDRETLVKKVQIVPVEVIVRNIVAGSLAKRLVCGGTRLRSAVIGYCYRTTISAIHIRTHIAALGLALTMKWRDRALWLAVNG